MQFAKIIINCPSVLFILGGIVASSGGSIVHSRLVDSKLFFFVLQFADGGRGAAVHMHAAGACTCAHGVRIMCTH